MRSATGKCVETGWKFSKPVGRAAGGRRASPPVFSPPDALSWEIPLAVHAARRRAPTPPPSFFFRGQRRHVGVLARHLVVLAPSVRVRVFEIARGQYIRDFPPCVSDRARSQISPSVSAGGSRDSPRTSPQKSGRPRAGQPHLVFASTFAGVFAGADRRAPSQPSGKTREEKEENAHHGTASFNSTISGLLSRNCGSLASKPASCSF